MTAPATEYPTMPRSAYARNLHDALNYQCAVNRVLLATTRPKGTPGPMLSTAELAEMDTAFALGLSAEGFAARLAARDRAGRAG